MTGADPSLPPSWEERLWLKNRHRFWWQLPLLAALNAWWIGCVYLAATKGIVYGGPKGRAVWVSVQDQPDVFWIYVALDCMALLLGLGIPAKVVFKMRALRGTRSEH